MGCTVGWMESIGEEKRVSVLLLVTNTQGNIRNGFTARMRRACAGILAHIVRVGLSRRPHNSSAMSTSQDPCLCNLPTEQTQDLGTTLRLRLWAPQWETVRAMPMMEPQWVRTLSTSPGTPHENSACARRGAQRVRPTCACGRSVSVDERHRHIIALV